MSVVQVLNASELQACLTKANRTAHIVDREDQIRECFKNKNNLKNLTGLQCFQLVANNATVQKLQNLKENLNAICFFDVAQFTTPQQCLNQMGVFQSADQHDEAVFTCYKKFQEKINKVNCQQIAKYMIYDDKKEVLNRRCDQLN